MPSRSPRDERTANTRRHGYRDRGGCAQVPRSASPGPARADDEARSRGCASAAPGGSGLADALRSVALSDRRGCEYSLVRRRGQRRRSSVARFFLGDQRARSRRQVPPPALAHLPAPYPRWRRGMAHTSSESKGESRRCVRMPPMAPGGSQYVGGGKPRTSSLTCSSVPAPNAARRLVTASPPR